MRPSQNSTILDVVDLLNTVRDLNKAIWMAAQHDLVTDAAQKALTAVSDELAGTLVLAIQQLNKLRERDE